MIPNQLHSNGSEKVQDRNQNLITSYGVSYVLVFRRR